MAAFAACGYAKFSGDVGVCVATSGPGAIHLLNGLYDARLDHAGVVAIVVETARSAIGGCPLSGGRPAHPVQGRRRRVLPDGHGARAAPERAGQGHPHRRQPADGDRGDHPLRRAGARVRRTSRTPSRWCRPAWIRPGPRRSPTADDLDRAADLLNAGSKARRPASAQGARGAVAEIEPVGRDARCRGGQGAAGQGRVVRRAPVGHRFDRGCSAPSPSYELMRDCDTLLVVGSNFVPPARSPLVCGHEDSRRRHPDPRGPRRAGLGNRSCQADRWLTGRPQHGERR